MSGNVLPDTSVIVELLRGNPVIRSQLEQSGALYTFSVILGELFYGARISGKVIENMQSINSFANETTLLTCDVDTAREYSLIRKQLRDKGRPIPENDIWIAAAARQHTLTLVTRDAHFSVIDGLNYESW